MAGGGRAGALAAAAGCGAAAVSTRTGRGGRGGAGLGVATSSCQAAAGDAKNQVNRLVASANFLTDGDGAAAAGNRWRSDAGQYARVRKCSPRPSAPPRRPSRPGQDGGGDRSPALALVSARLSGRALAARSNRGAFGPRSGGAPSGLARCARAGKAECVPQQT